MELNGKHVMVIGLGVSGRAAAKFLAARGARLVMTDLSEDVALADLPAGEVHLGAEDPAWLAGSDFGDHVDLVVASPGVPPTSALMIAARAHRIPIMSELELGSRFVSAPLLAITGTNGKSTVTVMIGEIFKAAGWNAFVGGNLGTPLVEAACGNHQVAVIEVSSYQLELISTFKPRVAIHLNLTDDHLDRYRNLEEYGQAKARLFENQDGDDWAVLNRDDANVWKLARQVRSRVFSFGFERPATSSEENSCVVWCEGDAIVFDVAGNPGRIALGGFKLPGRHNLLNAMAAAAAALAMEIAPGVIERAFAGFTGLPHRTELVRVKDGVTYIDDSKGTNVGAVEEALAATTGPVILIAGGVDKGGDYGPLRAPLKEKVKLLILIGAAREKMRAALDGATTIESAPALADAVKIAAAHARQGDTVMLSPACSSFDQFKDYAERGRVFQELVRAL
jgi:UDP-N-acetylmuramoylalanine--D-glutamate ligase